MRVSEAADVTVAQPARTAESSSPLNRPRRIFAAAAVFLAASITIVVLQRSNSHETAPVVRALENTYAAPAVASISPGDGAAIKRDDVVLRWTANPPGLFRVVVLDSTGSPVVVHETNETTFAVPSSVTLQPGATYFWRVDVLADGITASTTANRFVVAR